MNIEEILQGYTMYSLLILLSNPKTAHVSEPDTEYSRPKDKEPFSRNQESALHYIIKLFEMMPVYILWCYVYILNLVQIFAKER